MYPNSSQHSSQIYYLHLAFYQFKKLLEISTSNSIGFTFNPTKNFENYKERKK